MHWGAAAELPHWLERGGEFGLCNGLECGRPGHYGDDEHPLSTNAVWTLPGSSILASATGIPNAPSSILLSGLSFSSGVALLSGTLSGSLGLSQTGGSSTNFVSAPIVIHPATNGGNWYLDGTVRYYWLDLARWKRFQIAIAIHATCISKRSA